MNKSMLLASAAVISVALLSGGAGAQGTPQTVELVKVDVQKLSAGYRSSQVVGGSVVNDASETIGKIDDPSLAATASDRMRCCRSAAFWAWTFIWLSCRTTRSSLPATR